MNEAVRKRVLAIYAEADREVEAAGPVCLVSGRCCRFQEFGHVLYVSNLEAEVLLASAPSFARPVDEAGCPFQKDRLCTAREHRPLGCRVFHCDPGYANRCGEITEKYLRKLKDLAEAEGIAWEYAPVHHFFKADPAGEGGFTRCAADGADSRTA